MSGYSSPSAGSSYRNFERDSEYIYRHLLDIRKSESPDVLVERLRSLFIEGIHYPEAEALRAVNRMVLSEWASSNFPHVLNRCCYILINHWWSHSELNQKLTKATHDLVALFLSNSSPPEKSLATQRLRELIREFTKTEQYQALQRRAQVVGGPSPTEGQLNTQDRENVESKRIIDLIHRYPLLYSYYLRGEDSEDSGDLRAIERLQIKREQQFEQDLFHYMTYMQKSSNSSCNGALSAVKNPTLMSTEDLRAAVMTFGGAVKGSPSYRDAAKQSLSTIAQAVSYQDMKEQVHEYLLSSIRCSANPDYGNHRFNSWLSEQLKSTLPQGDTLKPSTHLLMRTCGHLIDVLLAKPHVSDHKSVENHLMFVDLNTNLGATFTIGLLLKIVLLCAANRGNFTVLKSRIAKQFACMFRHYETAIRSNTEWLIRCLDNLMVAFSIHFGRHSFSNWTSLLDQ
ncbi:hypothetical protein H6F88_04645 [Oculatella sp. FACHB-28]|uniref:hypothetical protein n=1 Tax=Oculatella sp. FACHB-28 TaxID=2692845 RepID=UPI001684CFC8|nr:hypothetical protein [Oculatella sp. FACHB-28]MBD2055319.1 hypothetical protein [Oculatella sp. FACHB-28]